METYNGKNLLEEPVLARGAVIGCVGLDAPHARSDPAAMQTRARRSSDGWELTGTKMWITNGSLAQVAIVWAKDEDGEIRGFIVETDRPGFSAHEIKTKSSMRASDTSELVLEGVRLPEGAALPEAVRLRSALMCLTQARYGIAWGARGAAARCLGGGVSL